MKGSIVWLVPFPLKGSGGHRTLFTHINNLVDRGYACHVYIGNEGNANLHDQDLRELVEQYFGSCGAVIHAGYQVQGRYDLAVATVWWTASLVANQVDAREKVYFVQDFEPWFNPMGDNFILAENSYGLGLIPVTIGRWLAHLMRETYGAPSRFFEFTAEQSIYFPDSATKRENAVCFVYQPEKPRRCPALGGEALAFLKYHSPATKIYTFGSDEEPNFPFEFTHLGLLSLKQCNALYNRCRVGLCLSSSNPSRIPFEMMAAGLPVVDFFGENTLYDLPDEAVLLAQRTPDSLAAALKKIIDSRTLRQSMRDAGRMFMHERPSTLEYEQVAHILEAIMHGEGTPPHLPAPLYKAPAFAESLSAPPPQILPPPESVSRPGLLYWLQNNRISRAIKVLMRGYC